MFFIKAMGILKGNENKISFRNMERVDLIQMILCIIAGGLTWKIQSNGTKIVA